jgi:hypothetical protein
MRSLASLISAFAFLLHMWLGCCAHHGHNEAQAAGAGYTHAAAPSHAHAGHDHAAGAAGEESSHDSHSRGEHCPGGHGERCNDGECVFLSVGKTTVAKNAPVALLPLLASDAADKLVTAPQARAINTGGLPALAVRLHLLHQVFLS